MDISVRMRAWLIFCRYDITTLKKLQSSDSEDVRGVFTSGEELWEIIKSEFIDNNIPASRVVIGGISHEHQLWSRLLTGKTMVALTYLCRFFARRHNVNIHGTGRQNSACRQYFLLSLFCLLNFADIIGRVLCDAIDLDKSPSSYMPVCCNCGGSKASTGGSSEQADNKRSLSSFSILKCRRFCPQSIT